MSQTSPGAALRRALTREAPLQIAGVINANHALLAKRSGFMALYLSGAGVSLGSLGMPDLGIASLEDTLIDARRISDVCDLPLLVDGDSISGPSVFTLARMVKALSRCGAAALHIDDSVPSKQYGDRANKVLLSKQEMVDRIASAVEARTDDNFIIGVRTHATKVDGVEPAIDRAQAYAQAGAELLLAEGVSGLDRYSRLARATRVPLLASMAEFDETPLFTVEELRSSGVGGVVYPLSAFRAMNKAAETVYSAIRREGTQRSVVDTMQTRRELDERINYRAYERRLGVLLSEPDA